VPGEKKKATTIGPEHEIKVLAEISASAQKKKAEKGDFEEILGRLGEIIDFRSASLYLFSPQSGKLEETCTVGRKVDLIDFVNFEMGSGISAWVAKQKRPVILNNLRKSQGGTHTKSFLSVPIISSGDVKGVVNLAHDEPDSYTARDSQVVSIAASIIALIAERMHYIEILSARERDIESMKQATGISLPLLPGDGAGTSGHSSNESIGRKIANSLAIISGNAQFLAMTMKTSGSSVLKRLRAIEKEAANVLALTKAAENTHNSQRHSSRSEREAQPSVCAD
jgi:signal transduction protein with GAF and PtsI domain